MNHQEFVSLLRKVMLTEESEADFSPAGYQGQGKRQKAVDELAAHIKGSCKSCKRLRKFIRNPMQWRRDMGRRQIMSRFKWGKKVTSDNIGELSYIFYGLLLAEFME